MLENISQNAYNLLTNSRFWMILLAVIFFLFLAGYVYTSYVSPMVNKDFIPNDEFPKNNDSVEGEEVLIYMFTVTWCPHSKKAMPIWTELKEKYNNTKYNNHLLKFIEVDGEENVELADQYKIDSFPTIKMIKNGQVIEYDAKPTIEHLEEFLRTTLSS
jgi:thiol-disulfide isomerase/thioredoxin